MLTRVDLRSNRHRRDTDVHLQPWRVAAPSSPAFLDLVQQRTPHLLGQPSRQLMNRRVYLIERGQERRGPGSLPERSYRLICGQYDATQLINHDGCSDSEV